MRLSRKLWLALAAVVTAATIGGVTLTLLLVLTAAAERDGGVYPFRDEDWLRYHLPSLWPEDEKLMLVTGPSIVREGIDADLLQAAHPDYRVYNGGMSLATITDVRVSLEYIEQRYGNAALPRSVVLGLSPRFLLDIPEWRPYLGSIDRYSPTHLVEEIDGAAELVPKPTWEGFAAWSYFLVAKQGQRIRGALAWWALDGVGEERGRAVDESRLARAARPIGGLMGRPHVGELGFYGAMVEDTNHYRFYGKLDSVESVLETMNEAVWWAPTYSWDPAAENAGIRAAVLRLVRYADTRDIDLIPVSMPERRFVRQQFEPEFSDAYADLLDTLFPMPVLHARCYLSDAVFYDLEHYQRSGATQLTKRLIRHMQEISKPVIPASGRAMPGSEECSEGAIYGN